MIEALCFLAFFRGEVPDVGEAIQTRHYYSKLYVHEVTKLSNCAPSDSFIVCTPYDPPRFRATVCFDPPREDE